MASELTPAQVRDEFRRNTKQFAGTCGLAPGYLQASVLFFPSSFADDFEEFCKLNSAPLPLLYRSPVGQFDAPPLAKDSDARTDVGLYSIFKDGNFLKSIDDVTELNLTNMATFYIGCSYGFEEAMVKSGIKLAHYRPGGCVGTFLSGISNYPVGDIGGTMVLTMRPIKRGQLEVAYNISGALEGAHGAPVHMGDPQLIGVDLHKPLLGSAPDGIPEIAEDEVPVFWGCGTTSCIAGITGKSRFTQKLTQIQPPMYVGQWEHSVAFMFVSDVKSEDYFTDEAKTNVNSKIVQLTEKPLFLSALSHQAWKQITSLDSCIDIDKAKNIKEQDCDLVKVALTLSHSSSVTIATNMSENQNDVISLLRAVTAVKEDVKLLVPENKVVSAAKMLVDAKARGTLKKQIEIASVQNCSVEVKDLEILLIMYPDCNVYHAPEFAVHRQSDMFTSLVKLPPRPPLIVDVQRFGIEAFAVALFHLNNCPVHSRYMRRGRGAFSPLAYENFINEKNEIKTLV